MSQIRIFCLLFFGIVLFLGGALSILASSNSVDVNAGRRLFRSQDWTGTGLTCLHCHADFNEKKEPDDYIRPAYSLFNSGNRTEWEAWEGKARKIYSLEEVVSICMIQWMTKRDEKGDGTLPAKHHLRQILAYLQWEEMAPETKSKPVKLKWAKEVPSDDHLKQGDPNLGQEVFQRSCVSCHKSDGSGPAPSLVRNGYSRYQIAKKVRGLDNPGLAGLVMPPFPKSRLSDRQLINVAAFVFEM